MPSRSTIASQDKKFESGRDDAHKLATREIRRRRRGHTETNERPKSTMLFHGKKIKTLHYETNISLKFPSVRISQNVRGDYRSTAIMVSYERKFFALFNLDRCFFTRDSSLQQIMSFVLSIVSGRT